MTKKRILYCDDYASFGIYFTLAAEAFGYEPVFVDDAASAWELIEAGETFDLIISDNDMPKMTGINFLERLRQHPTAKDTPFALYSGNDSQSLKLRASELGAVVYDKSASFRKMIADHLPPS